MNQLRPESRFPIFQDRFRQLQGEMTNTEFADFLGMTRQTVGFYLNGNRIPDIHGLRKIAEKCNVSADWLIGMSDVKNVDPNIKAICQYTGLKEETILALHEMGKTEGGYLYTKAFLDTFIGIENRTIDVFERNARRAILALNAHRNHRLDQGGSAELDELRELSDDEFKDSIQELMDYERDRERKLEADLISNDGITISFEDADAFFESRAVGYLDGIFQEFVTNYDCQM